MRRALLLPLFLSLAFGPGEPEVLPTGGDLAQFDRVGLAADSMAIVDGEVRMTGKPLGYFATKRAYRDFTLTFEYRYDRPADLKAEVDFRGNSGVLLHIVGPAKVWPTCVQVQLAQSDPGAIFPLGDAACEANADPEAQRKAIHPVGEWNRVEVTSRGGSIVAVLNGVEVARGEKAEPAEGPIGWQSEGKPVRFRAIWIQSLP